MCAAASAAGVLTRVLLERPVRRRRARLVPGGGRPPTAEPIPLRRLPERALERAA
jgi:hypothetical protein